MGKSQGTSTVTTTAKAPGFRLSRYQWLGPFSFVRWSRGSAPLPARGPNSRCAGFAGFGVVVASAAMLGRWGGPGSCPAGAGFISYPQQRPIIATSAPQSAAPSS